MSEPPSLPGVTHDWVDAGGLRTHVALAGDRDAPPVLLVHGWPQNWWAWREVIPALASGHRVIAPDLRGHGWTDAPREGYEKEQFASDLLALLDAMGIDRATWVGHDWGGFASMLAALRAPERFERLVTAGIPHLWDRSFDPRRLALLLGYQVPVSTPLLGPFIVRRGFVRRLLAAGRVKGRFSDEDLRIFDEPLRASPHSTVQTYRTFLTREVVPLARGRYADRTLEVPSRLLIGSKDIVTRTLEPGPVEGQPQLTVESIEGVGHFSPEEAPERVSAALT
jgi:pimeloyl-ACP methyl ester carboxylesterase